MNSILDKTIEVEGAIKDDKYYNAEGKELKPIAPRSIQELKQIEKMMDEYPNLDYLMCLLLIQATPEQLEKIAKNPKKRQLNTSTILKQDFYVEEEIKDLNNLVIS